LLLSLRVYRRILMAAALLWGSHALHDTFSVIRWRSAGIDFFTVSALWSVSVFSEVVVFLFTREAVDDEILAYRLQYGVVGYLLGVVLAQARSRNALGDTTGHDAALEIINEVAGVTGHRVAPSER
jgi:hypothetical protein